MGNEEGEPSEMPAVRVKANAILSIESEKTNSRAIIDSQRSVANVGTR
jgi:hypothetical protein